MARARWWAVRWAGRGFAGRSRASGILSAWLVAARASSQALKAAGSAMASSRVRRRRARKGWLWRVSQRKPRRRSSTGDFSRREKTWAARIGAAAFGFVFFHGLAEGFLGGGGVSPQPEDVGAEEVGLGTLVASAEAVDDAVGDRPLAFKAGEEGVVLSIGGGEGVGFGEFLPSGEGFLTLAERGAEAGELAEGGGIVGAEAQGGLETHEGLVGASIANLLLGEACEFPALSVGPFAVGPAAAGNRAPKDQNDRNGDPKGAAAENF